MRKAGSRLALGLVSLLLAVGGPAMSQIVVGRAGERNPDRKQYYGWCDVTVDGVDYVSGIVYLPNDDFYDVFAKAYSAFAEANIGHVRDVFCDHDFGSAESADAKIDVWITNNPNTHYQRQGWTGNFPTRGSKSITASQKPKSPLAHARVSPVETPIAKGPTPNQLKYQNELAAYKQRLAEIERIKADTAARHAADQAAARQQLSSHEQDMARHRKEVADAAAAQQRYQEELATHQRLVQLHETKEDRERKVDWREAIVVCDLDPANPQSRFGNWRCDGPLQMTYAKLGGSGGDRQAMIALGQACGRPPESVRDLGMVNTSHLFGCSYGLHPKSNGFPVDAAAKHGISYVPGRAIYRCPAWKTACQTQ